MSLSDWFPNKLILMPLLLCCVCLIQAEVLAGDNFLQNVLLANGSIGGERVSVGRGWLRPMCTEVLSHQWLQIIAPHILSWVGWETPVVSLLSPW